MGVLALTAGTASADYGAGAVYQVEISANPPGNGIWYWAALYAPADGNPATAQNPGTGDYQEADCIHLGGGHQTDAAAHDAGDVSWYVDNGNLVMNGVEIIAGAETVDLSVPLPASGYGHVHSVTVQFVSGEPLVQSGTISGNPLVQVQIAR